MRRNGMSLIILLYNMAKCLFLVVVWATLASCSSDITDTVDAIVKIQMGQYRQAKYSCQPGMYWADTGNCESCDALCQSPTNMCYVECMGTYQEKFVFQPKLLSLKTEKAEQDSEIASLRVCVYVLTGAVSVLALALFAGCLRNRHLQRTPAKDEEISGQYLTGSGASLLPKTENSSISEQELDTTDQSQPKVLKQPIQDTEGHEPPNLPWQGVPPQECEDVASVMPQQSYEREANRDDPGGITV